MAGIDSVNAAICFNCRNRPWDQIYELIRIISVLSAVNTRRGRWLNIDTWLFVMMPLPPIVGAIVMIIMMMGGAAGRSQQCSQCSTRKKYFRNHGSLPFSAESF